MQRVLSPSSLALMPWRGETTKAGSLEEVLLGIEAAETSAYAELRAEVCRSDHFAHSLLDVCKQEKNFGELLWNPSVTLVHMPETQKA